jgi:hypothetical protein
MSYLKVSKRFINLMSMLFIILLGFSLLVADSDGDHINFLVDETKTSEEIHGDFLVFGTTSFYDSNDGKERNIKKSELNLGVQVNLITETEPEGFKTLYTAEPYPIEINGRDFELFFSADDLKLEEEFNRLKALDASIEYINIQVNFKYGDESGDPETNEYYYRAFIGLKYSPEIK